MYVHVYGVHINRICIKSKNHIQQNTLNNAEISKHRMLFMGNSYIISEVNLPPKITNKHCECGK